MSSMPSSWRRNSFVIAPQISGSVEASVAASANMAAKCLMKKNFITRPFAYNRRAHEGEETMQAMLKLSRAIDALNEFIGRWIYWLVLAVVLISAGNAIIRKTFSMSSNAWLELQWYLFSAIFLLSAGFTLF